MGLFGKKISKEEQFKISIGKKLQANNQISLVDIYNQEKTKENELRYKQDRPPVWCLKPESYKKTKDAEIAALRSTYSNAIDIDIIDEANARATEVEARLKNKRDNHELTRLSDIEAEYNQLKQIDMVALKPSGFTTGDSYSQLAAKIKRIQTFNNYKNVKDDLAEKSNTLQDKIIEDYSKDTNKIVKMIFDDDTDADSKMKFLKEKHSDIINLICYSALIDPILEECNEYIRTNTRAVGRNAKQYANLYGQKLIVGKLLAEALNARDIFVAEYELEQVKANNYNLDDDYISKQPELDEDVKTLEQQDAEDNVEILEYQKIEDNVEINDELKTEISEEDLIFSPVLNKYGEQSKEKSHLKTLWDMYDKCSLYMDWPEKFDKFTSAEDKHNFMQQLADWGCFSRMGDLSEITMPKSSLCDPKHYGATFLREKNATRFWEYVKLAVLQRLAEIYRNKDNMRFDASQKIAVFVENKRKEWQSEFRHQEKVSNLKSEFFKKYVPDTMLKVANDHPYYFAYYEFMNDEVVKTNNYNKAPANEKSNYTPGLFSNEDFHIFDSNDPVALQNYLKGFERKFKNQFIANNYGHIYDSYYKCLEIYVNSHIKSINTINEAKPNPSVRYEVEQTGKNQYFIKNYERTLQTSGQGCWSVAMSKLLESRGITLDQKDIRAFKADLNTNHNHYFIDSYENSTNSVSSIENHINLLAKLLPDQIVRQTSFGLVGGNIMTQKLLEATDKAILEQHTPLPIVYNGHFRIIYGRDGDELLIHDPIKSDEKRIPASKLAKNAGYNASIFWLENKPEANKGNTVILDTDGKKLYYDKRGNIQREKLDGEVLDAGLSFRHYNYYQYIIDTKMDDLGLVYDYVYLTDNRRKNNKPGAKTKIDTDSTQ